MKPSVLPFSFIAGKVLSRVFFLTACFAMYGLLSGCSSPPKPAVVEAASAPAAPAAPPVPTLENSLKEMGFTKEAEGYVLNIEGRVLFETGQAILLPPAQESIGAIARKLRAFQLERVRLIGHTDNTGSDALNQRLSLARARAVATAFVAQGFGESSLEAIGHGSSRPIATNATLEGRQQNRRVSIVIPF